MKTISRAARAIRRLGWLGALLIGLQGCAISTPVPQLGGQATDADPPVLLVLTAAELDASRRAEFDRQARLVAASLDHQPGLIGHSIRRELWGARVWTMTVWRDEGSLREFLQGQVHRNAVATAYGELRAMKTRRFALRARDLPANWNDALLLLDDPAVKPRRD